MDPFEEFLKNEAAGFKLEPSEKVWKGVQSGLQARKRRVLIIYSAVASVVVLLLVSLFLMQHKATDAPVSTEQKITHPSTPNLTPSVPDAATAQSHMPPVSENVNATRPVIHNTKATSPVSATPAAISVNANRAERAEQRMLRFAPAQANALSQFKVLPSVASLGDVLRPEMIELKPKQGLATTRYYVTAGSNITHSFNSGALSHFIKVAPGFNVFAGIRHNITSKVALSAGLSYQRSRYHLGVVSIQPEKYIYGVTWSGVKAYDINYRLNNESYQSNALHSFSLPLGAEFTVFSFPQSAVALLAGCEPAMQFASKYYVLVPGTDRIIENEKLVRRLNLLADAGIGYSRNLSNKQVLLVRYTLHQQVFNTLRAEEKTFTEKRLSQGLSVGIAF